MIEKAIVFLVLACLLAIAVMLVRYVHQETNGWATAVIVLAAALLALTGCSARDIHYSPANPVSAITYAVPGGWAYEWHLQDGTRCVTITSSSNSLPAITCEWGSAGRVER